MQPISIDVLQHILGHLDEASLVKICQLNKICCFYSQNVLYRKIQVYENFKVLETLAHSTHLARRVRTFCIFTLSEQTIPNELLRKSLQNMTNLTLLWFGCPADFSVLDGCTFRLVSFHASFYQTEHLVPFLHSQPSLTDVTIAPSSEGFANAPSSNDVAFASTCLPNLTQISADLSWLQQLIPNRPVSKVMSIGNRDPVDLSIFTLSTAPIRELSIDHFYLYTPVPLLASIFPSLTFLSFSYSAFDDSKETVRFINNFVNPNRMVTVSVIDYH
jgi:hypothetical protein